MRYTLFSLSLFCLTTFVFGQHTAGSLKNGVIRVTPPSPEASGLGQYGEWPAYRQITYYSYDRKGNLLQFTGKDGVTTSFVCGCEYDKAVAKILGADQAAVNSKINVSNIQSLTGAGLRTQLNNLRTITGAQVIAFTHDPLIGILTTSDLKNFTTYYECDALGRLPLGKDHHLNVVKTIEY